MGMKLLDKYFPPSDKWAVQARTELRLYLQGKWGRKYVSDAELVRYCKENPTESWTGYIPHHKQGS